jgi:hypothetical protein
VSGDEIKVLSAMMRACDEKLFLKIVEKSSMGAKFVELFNAFDAESETIKILKKSSFSVEDLFVRLLIFDSEIDESTFKYYREYFNLYSTVTHDGICMSFNMIRSDDVLNKEIISEDYVINDKFNNFTSWQIDEGYKDLSSMVYPLNIYKSLNFNLKFIFATNMNDTNNLCVKFQNSFHFFLHLPNEIPHIFSENIYASTGDHHQR